MSFQDVAFLPYQACFSPYFLLIVVDVIALGPPHVLKLFFGVGKDMIPVKYFCSNKASFFVSVLVSIKFHVDHMTVTKIKQNLATLSFGHVTGFRTLVFLSLYCLSSLSFLHFVPVGRH